MVKNKRNVYDLTLGILGLGFVLFFSLFRLEYTSFDILLFIIFLVVGLILQRIELRISEFTLTFDIAVIIATYIILGLAPTLWIILLLFFAYRVIIDKLDILLAFSNAGMLINAFVLIHILFNNMGYKYSQSFEISNAVIIVAFAIMIFILNWGFIVLYFKLTRSKLPDSWLESLKWDFYGNIITVPLSFLLIEGYYYYNYIGLIILSLLIVLVNMLFRLLRNIVFLNNELRVVHETSVTISANLELSETTSNIIDGINELVNCDYCAIIKFDTERMVIESMETKTYNDVSVDDCDVKNYIEENIEEILNLKNSFIVDSFKKTKNVLEPRVLCKDLSSMLYEPLIVKDDLIGCLLICNKRKHGFIKEKLVVMDIIANQAAIAIENARMYKETKNKAIKDSLTGLYNQSYFFSTLEAITGECDFCQKTECNNCRLTSLIIFDIDFFKKINDNHGHPTGDKVLKDITAIIKSNVRKSDIVSRYGGEEFTVILPNTDENTAYTIAERIRNIIENTEFSNVYGEPIHVTISGGVSEFPNKADSGSALLAYADRAMYIGAKRKGRNRISKYVS